MPIGSPNSGQKATSFPQMTAARPGNIEVQNSGPGFVNVPAGGGTVILASGAATVVDARVTANSIILLTLKTASGTVAVPFVATITPGTGFTVGGGGSDNSTYNYAIFG